MRTATAELFLGGLFLLLTLTPAQPGCMLPLAAADWTRFRGPNGSGISPDADRLPTTWSPTENVLWKVELPGPGASSPIVVGRRVFVTCWSGYGIDRGHPGDFTDLRRHLVCVDAESGNIRWSKAVAAVLPETTYGSMLAEHGYASHTPVSDGQRVYAFFGKTGVIAFDLQGEQVWRTSVGENIEPRAWGSAASPILFGSIVIVPAFAESGSLLGLDAETGRILWRQAGGGLQGTWGTPVLVTVNDERTDLAIGIPGEIRGFDPRTGDLRWYCAAMPTDAICSSVVTDYGVVFAVAGRQGGAIAVYAGGSGDVLESHRLWTTRQTNRIGTPLVHEGRLFFVSRGMVNCLVARSGAVIFAAPLAAEGEEPGPRGNQGAVPRKPLRFGSGVGFGGDYSSPVLGDGKLFYVSRSGSTYVFKPGNTYEPLAVNRVTANREEFVATPAISNGRIFIRSNRHLYGIGLSAAAVDPPPAEDSPD